MRRLSFVLRFVGLVQAGFGVLFVVAPSAVAPALALEPSSPRWVDWLFVMAGARFLGYAVGMFLASGDPARHVAWIDTMIVVQALDWLSTLAFLATGDASLRNVSTAAFLPPLFIVALLRWHPRRVAA